MTARGEAIEAAARALVDALKWEDELMSYVLTRNATLSALRLALAPRSERREGEPTPEPMRCPKCGGPVRVFTEDGLIRWACIGLPGRSACAPAAPKEEA